jgi:uncharacterized protein
MESVSSGHAAALWAGLHLFLILTLSVLVVRQRRRRRVALGDGGSPELAQAIRAHGNAAEYVPAALAALAVMAVVGASPVAVHLTGGLMFLGRLVHAVGLSRSGGATPARAWGTLLTWLAYLIAGATLMVYAVA